VPSRNHLLLLLQLLLLLTLLLALLPLDVPCRMHWLLLHVFPRPMTKQKVMTFGPPTHLPPAVTERLPRFVAMMMGLKTASYALNAERMRAWCSVGTWLVKQLDLIATFQMFVLVFSLKRYSLALVVTPSVHLLLVCSTSESLPDLPLCRGAHRESVHAANVTRSWIETAVGEIISHARSPV
jgi:hypothetical protein